MAPRKDFLISTPTAAELQDLYDVPDHGNVPSYLPSPLEEALNNHSDVIFCLDSLYELAREGSGLAIKALADLSEFGLHTAMRCKDEWVEKGSKVIPPGGAA